MTRQRAGRLVRDWLPPLILGAFLLSLGGTADLRFATARADDLLIRKLGHAAAYGLIALLWYRAVVAWSPYASSRGVRWIVPLVLTAAIAIGDELLQSIAPGRQMKTADVLLDMTGALSVLILLRSWQRRAGATPRLVARTPSADPSPRSG